MKPFDTPLLRVLHGRKTPVNSVPLWFKRLYGRSPQRHRGIERFNINLSQIECFLCVSFMSFVSFALFRFLCILYASMLSKALFWPVVIIAGVIVFAPKN